MSRMLIAGIATVTLTMLWSVSSEHFEVHAADSEIVVPKQKPQPPRPATANGASAKATPSPIQPVAPLALTPNVAAPLEGPDLKDVPTWSELARAILLTAIPDKYEDLKHWGQTREIFDGIQVQQRGLNLRFSERKRRVNDGTWYKFTVRFPQPEKNASILIDQVETRGLGKFSFAIHVALKQVRVHGQFEQWILGVKGFNFDMESDVEVHLHAVCQMVIHSERRSGSLLPDLILDPSIRGIRLDLVDVNTRRVGRVGGDLAAELGNSSRQFLEDLLHAQEGRVLKKANEAIQKKKESLRIPTSRLW